MEFLTNKSSVYLTLLVLIGTISRFLHIVFNVKDIPGIFGYTYMSSFLNAFGINISFLCSALLVKFSAKKVQSYLKTPIDFGANMFLYVSCFFMTNLFIPKKELFGTPDFPAYYYWLSMVFISIISGKLLMLFQEALIYSEEKLKALIRNMFRFIIKDLNDKDMIKEKDKSFYKKKKIELVKEALDI